MQIKNHKLSGSGIAYQESPNHSGKFQANLPDTIVIHYTAGSSAQSSVKTLCDPDTKASAHLVVGRDDSITQLVPFDTVAWHAGRSSYAGRSGYNKYSIGIEIDNAGRLSKSGNSYAAWFGRRYDADDVVEATHRNESRPDFWHAYTEGQIQLVNDLCKLLMAQYPIKAILGHEEIAPQRKSDPGPAFPLDRLRDRLLEADRSQEEAEQPVRFTASTGVVTASRLNVREAGEAGAPVVLPPLSKGTLVEILGERNGWYQVEIKTRGWVKADYVKTAAV